MKRFSTDTASVSRLISESGVKPSHQRILVLQYLMEHRHHPSVDDIYRALSPEHPTLSRTTVYNSLRLLASAGIIRSIPLGGSDGDRWDFPMEPHAHFICNACGELTDVPLDTASIPLPPGGFEVTVADISLRGLCPQCRGILAHNH